VRVGARRLFLVAALGVVAALGAVGSAQACSCAQLAPQDALRQADAAIVGELLKVLPRGDGVADFRYEVKRVYKSVRRIGSIVSVRSTTQSAACGLPAQVGRHYGLLLDRGGGRWRGGLCGVMAPRRLRAAAERQNSRIGGASELCDS
jgi:hypothetical protein